MKKNNRLFITTLFILVVLLALPMQPLHASQHTKPIQLAYWQAGLATIGLFSLGALTLFGYKWYATTAAHSKKKVSFKDKHVCTLDDTLLQVAANPKTDISRIQDLIDAKANIECSSEELQTPLIRAAQAGNMQLVRFLAERGADVDRRDKQHHNAADYVWQHRDKLDEDIRYLNSLSKEQTDGARRTSRPIQSNSQNNSSE